jgi:TRAP transporter 4TM/12TM fusion protein
MVLKAPDPGEIQKLEEQFDPEVRFRPQGRAAEWIVGALLLALSSFHYYTAGFGLLREQTHRGIHMAFVLGLIFLVFAVTKRRDHEPPRGSWWRPAGIAWPDWIFAIGAAAASLYVPAIFDDLAFRVGNPLLVDVVMGTILIVVLLEATRRSVGWPLPIIALVFILYAHFGPDMPGVLAHAGSSWTQIVNHLYLTSQGIYGIALGVVATYVFHFVLFGVLATRVGLGRLFIDLASCVAGRFAGGPAKVSIFGSGLFGMISGSSIANTVTVGSLTIPAMIRLGYPRHFAAAVESTASTGGQITPPIMGAAAFLMIEYLNKPYQQIILAAIVPAAMHFFGVFMQVHFEAKRSGLRGLSPAELPNARAVIRRDWITIFPLALLLVVLFSGASPYLSAFYGITGCIVVGMAPPLLAALWSLGAAAVVEFGNLEFAFYALLAAGVAVCAVPHAKRRLTFAQLVEGFVTGAKYAIAVGAAAATVGIIVGVVTLTGVGFRITDLITSYAGDVAAVVQPLLPGNVFGLPTITLFFTLILTGVVCILLGCGIPTTANYIIMVTVAAPVLGKLGVEPIVAHFFVFYYGVLADITPPVALAAYAGASMAGADPFRTGNTAFRLGLGKVLVPFVFVYSPAMLIVTKAFNWYDFVQTTVSCAVGIAMLSAAFSRYMWVRMQAWECLLAGIGAVVMVAPGIETTLAGLVIAAPVIVRQILASRAPAHVPTA